MAKTNPNTTALVPVETPTLTAVKGHGRTTSLQVAEHFGRRHDNVLRAIRDLGCSEKFSLLNFEAREFVDERGKVQPMVEMTRDGFAILVMRFTGPQAMAWKERYIEAFNQLEQAYIDQIEQKAQATIDASEKRVALRALPSKELAAHHEEGMKILSQLRRETDPFKQKLYYNLLKHLYWVLGEELDPLETMAPQPLLIETGPSRAQLMEQVEELARVRDMLLSALRGLTAAARPHLLPDTAEEMPEVFRAAAQAIKVANHQKGGAA